VWLWLQGAERNDDTAGERDRAPERATHEHERQPARDRGE
jgi:hypothetical protein